MDDISHNTQLIDKLIAISKEDGETILKVYNSDFDYKIKEDSSPLTEADKISHQIIINQIRALTPDIPIISEEDSDSSFQIRSKWKIYWLIDPLDGTKEFIKKNGEFTVNIALIKNNTPILGVIHIPVSNETYWGSKLDGSFHQKEYQKPQRINVSDCRKDSIRILTSRSHPDKILNSILTELDDYQIIKKGSSLKFCFIASGRADLYIRLGPTSEWDTGAGEAIVRFAGGYTSTIDGKSITYNLKESILNPNFMVSNSKHLIDVFRKLIK